MRRKQLLKRLNPPHPNCSFCMATNLFP